MARFESSGDALLIRVGPEILRLEAWGDDSLRVRARMMGPILDWDWALPVMNLISRGMARGMSFLRTAVLTPVFFASAWTLESVSRDLSNTVRRFMESLLCV